MQQRTGTGLTLQHPGAGVGMGRGHSTGVKRASPRLSLPDPNRLPRDVIAVLEPVSHPRKRPVAG